LIKIELKKVERLNAGVLDYRVTLLTLCQLPRDPAKGTNFEEMEATMSLITKLALPLTSMLDLTEDEHRELVSRVTNARFENNDPATYKMIVAIMEATDDDDKTVVALS